MNKKTTLALAAAALLAVGPALAQGRGGAEARAPEQAGASASAGDAKDAKLERSDAKLLHELAESNALEINEAKIALQKAQDPQVKSFAQKMVDDHTRAQEQLRGLAEAKGAKLPKEEGMMAKIKERSLEHASGPSFDQHYVASSGAPAHEKTLKLLERARESKDADIRAMAEKMIPVVQRHLDMAKALPGAEAKSSAKKG